MRGEDYLAPLYCLSRQETPPHAWGRPYCSRRHSNACRKHPHMRGEDASGVRRYGAELETPPHAWGRHAKVSLERPKKGNTPTCVGKTPCTAARGNVVWKHPHMRGEDAVPSCRTAKVSETPPHAWGRHRAAEGAGVVLGNTPTCVGKTTAQRRVPGLYWETPPHAWGRLKTFRDDELFPRNTPTCVGKTREREGVPRRREKHPHMRGEDTKTQYRNYETTETPPHAWGRQAWAASSV